MVLVQYSYISNVHHSILNEDPTLHLVSCYFIWFHWGLAHNYIYQFLLLLVWALDTNDVLITMYDWFQIQGGHLL
jgi:hypothetical protein